ncbi:MAG: class I SAM-dependent methyltransferase [Candidatus Micrarchaeia archaeon]|jgi:SAM-dependent methyltransferase
MLDKLELILTMLSDSRFKNDVAAFKASRPLFVKYAWDLLVAVGAKRLLVGGVSLGRLMRQLRLKNSKLLESVLAILVEEGALRYSDGNYSFIREPVPPTVAQLSFLKEHYLGSLEWIEFVTLRAKKALLSGKPAELTGFEASKSLDLWEAIMDGAPHSFRRYAIRKFTRNIAKNSHVLDFGCGGGSGLEQILRETSIPIYLEGIDPSPKYLLRARRRLSKLKGQSAVVDENLGRLKLLTISPSSKSNDVFKQLERQKYDVVFLSLVLNHVPVDERSNLFQNLRSLLKPDGKLVIYQIINLGAFKRSPIWIMHVIPSHTEYPFKDEYLRQLKSVFPKVDVFFDGVVTISRNR